MNNFASRKRLGAEQGPSKGDLHINRNAHAWNDAPESEVVCHDRIHCPVESLLTELEECESEQIMGTHNKPVQSGRLADYFEEGRR